MLVYAVKRSFFANYSLIQHVNLEPAIPVMILNTLLIMKKLLELQKLQQLYV